MSGKPLAPSKDALRTLRFLAHSPSATFIGTAGAFCGVATLHYHERQKVRRAEEILNTKRKLHSITNGKGSARLASMFEAAERGDDFTIRRGRSVVDLRSRQHSTSAAQPKKEDAAEWKPFVEATIAQHSGIKQNHTDKTTSASQVVSKDEATWKPLNASTSTPTSHTGEKHASRMRSRSTPEESHYIASTPLHVPVARRSTKRVEYRPSGNADSSWFELAQRSLRGIRRDRDRLELAVEQDSNSQSSFSLAQPLIDQPHTDLSPLTASSWRSSAPPSHDTATRISADHKLSTSNLNPLSGFSMLQPWHISSEVKGSEDAIDSPPIVSNNVEPDTNLYFQLSDLVPAANSENLILSRYDLKRASVRQGLAFIGADRYAYVFSSFIDFQQQHGREEALLLLERTMEQYTMTDTRSDLAFAQALFLDCTRLFSASEIKPLVWRYVGKFLRGDTPKLEVVRFLYPRCGAGVESYEQHYYFLAHHYLDELRTKGYNVDQQVVELRKILAGTHMCGIKLHEHLLIPTLRSLCAVGRMTSAQALLDEIASAHHVQPTFYTLQILVKGHAKAGNWSKVKSILEECHSKELSQHKVYGSSSLLVSIINDYSLTQPVEEVVRFVIHCIQTYGLQPVSAVTRQIVMLCLRHRRYNLVVEWIEIVRANFPHVVVGIDSNTFAYDMMCVWRDLDSSCEEILTGCKAIASGTLRDPFSALFRSGISEATARYVTPRLDKLYQELGVKNPEQPLGQIDDFERILRTLEHSGEMGKAGARARLLLADLLSQSQALRGLNAICRGEFDFSGIGSRPMHIKDDMPDSTPALQQLPSLSELQDTLLDAYSERKRNGLSIDHGNLQKLVTELSLQDRKHDAFELIRTIHESKWSQSLSGQQFSLELFTDWLKLASDLKSGTMLRTVLWAITDADSTLKLSSHIILLARIAAPKTHVQKAKSARMNELAEVEYLRIRLKRRRWLKEQGKINFVFDEWRSFGGSRNARRSFR